MTQDQRECAIALLKSTNVLKHCWAHDEPNELIHGEEDIEVAFKVLREIYEDQDLVYEECPRGDVDH